MRELPLEKMLENVRRKSPLIHSITNYVTANDCANMPLACGASPIMAEDIGEAAEITSLCQGLVINLGTLNQNKIPSMLAAGRRANKLGHPVVFDPVGAGASKLRTQTALQMIKEIRFSVVRANYSEMKALMGGSEIGKTRGVDADVSDQITAENGEEAADFARRFARQTGAVAAITGAIDIVADADNVYSIRNGHPMMCSVTGTGCQLSALTAAFIAANPDMPLEAATAAVCAMGVCGEIGFGRLRAMDGNASYRNYIIDAMYHLTPEQLRKKARYQAD